MTEEQKSELYLNYAGKVRGYIQNKINDATAAEDLTAEVFLKVYEKLDSYDETRASLSTWIFTIARNTLTDYYRTRRVHGEIPETLASEEDIEEDICRDEMLETLADALEALDERSRDIIVLRYYSGLTLKVIAERLGISYAYVKVLHNKALGSLRGFF